ncbi:MAG: amidohydrolase family protein, partial [Christensenellales bacterium]|nr:amidohydrolase family protein [Christensenellales bacterium]
AIKLMGDGSLGARTAWLSRPYADAPDQRGIECTDAATMRAMVAEAARNGLPCAVHAIGDAAAETVLDAFALEGRGLRQAIVHAQIMLPEQVVRCGQMGLVILAQPIFLKADAPIVRARVGSLADSSYRWKQMLGGGAHVAFGTDCPVEPFDPMAGLYCAMSRRSTPQSEAYLPEEGFTLDEAVYAYTAAGAYAEGEEARKGRIQSGMAADFVVLSRRLCDEAPEALLETTVAKTYLAGQCVHGA